MEVAVLVAQALMVFATLYLAKETAKMVRATEQTLKVMQKEFVAERYPRVIVGGLFPVGGNGSVWVMNYSKREVGIFNTVKLVCRGCGASPWEAIEIFTIDGEEMWLMIAPGEIEFVKVKFEKLSEAQQIRERLALSFTLLYPDYPCSPLECYASFKEDFTLGDVECIPHIRGQESPFLAFKFAKLPKDCEQSDQ